MESAKELAMAFLLVLMACAASAAATPPPDYRLANLSKGRSVEIRMEIADTELARMRGLMFRPKVVPMLFVFGYTGLFPIHSHFVPAKFDAIYLSQDGRVVEVFREILPGRNRIAPTKEAAFLLELPPEITDRLGIEEGDRVQWTKR